MSGSLESHIPPPTSSHKWPEVPRANSISNFIPLPRLATGIRLFAPLGHDLHQSQLQRPLRVLVLTSLRDVAVSEGAGREVSVDDSRIYFKGSLHALVEASQRSFRPYLQVAGVVVDDVPGKDKVESCGYDILPKQRNGTSRQCSWIAPGDLEVETGKTLAEVVVNIPSTFRKLPMNAVAERDAQKIIFERRIINHALDCGADLILSDHCLVKFVTLHHSQEFRGRVINIHPGITWERDPNNVRGVNVTALTLQRAREKGYNRCGASLHFIDNGFDTGPVICDCENTHIDPLNETPESLRLKNYQASKIPALLEGLKHFSVNLANL